MISTENILKYYYYLNEARDYKTKAEASREAAEIYDDLSRTCYDLATTEYLISMEEARIQSILELCRTGR